MFSLLTEDPYHITVSDYPPHTEIACLSGCLLKLLFCNEEHETKQKVELSHICLINFISTHMLNDLENVAIHVSNNIVTYINYSLFYRMFSLLIYKQIFKVFNYSEARVYV